MAAKKKIKVDYITIEKEDTILVALLERYWKLVKIENIGKTLAITKAVDKLEEFINKRKQEIKDENA
jgi:hypothetical protein